MEGKIFSQTSSVVITTDDLIIFRDYLEGNLELSSIQSL